MPEGFHSQSVGCHGSKAASSGRQKIGKLTVELDREKLRKEAVEARRMADNASNEADRQFWLRIAEGWSKLILDAERK